MNAAAGGPRRTRAEWIEVMKTNQIGHWGTDRGADYDAAWQELLAWRDLGLWKEGDHIVEIGSGNGRLAIPLTEFDVRYVGVEPIRECVDYCRQAFQPWPHVRFEHVDLFNEMYNPRGSVRPEDFRFPIEDGEADVMLFGSVYTHLATLEVAKRYIGETWRSLRVEGRALLSWFRSPPNAVRYEADRTVYREADILNLTRPFEFLYTGGGVDQGFHDQWVMIVAKPDLDRLEPLCSSARRGCRCAFAPPPPPGTPRDDANFPPPPAGEGDNGPARRAGRARVPASAAHPNENGEMANVTDVLDERRIIQKLREDLGRRTRTAEPPPIPVASAPPPDDLRLHAGFDILDTGPMRSHRRLVGPAVVYAKRIARQLLMPILTRQIAYNAANTRAVQGLRSDLDRSVQEQQSAVAGLREQLGQSARALEQQLTMAIGALERRVETTAGQIGHGLELAAAGEREAAHRLAVLRADVDRVGLRQDRLERRAAAPGPPAPAPLAQPATAPGGDAAPPARGASGIDYAGLEDRFRGSEAEIKERQRPYLRHFKDRAPVLDIGCGRGEFLELLSEAGIAATGVDADRDMVLLCQDKGLDVAHGDAFRRLAAIPDGSLGGVFSAQFIEHFGPEQVQRLARLCHDKLRPGGVLIFETINPACVSVFGRSFYLDPTHVWPFHPELTRFLLEGAGFRDIALELLSPVDPDARLPQASPPAISAEDALAWNRAAGLINDLLLGHQDYALVAVKAADGA